MALEEKMQVEVDVPEEEELMENQEKKNGSLQTQKSTESFQASEAKKQISAEFRPRKCQQMTPESLKTRRKPKEDMSSASIAEIAGVPFDILADMFVPLAPWNTFMACLRNICKENKNGKSCVGQI